MSPLTEDQKREIIKLIEEGKLSREEIAEKVGVSPGTVKAIKAHITMGRYAKFLEEVEEVIEEAEKITFSFERDLQKALRSNIEQLEQGLKIIDGGKEQEIKVEGKMVGRIDITAEDKNGAIVVIELKAGKATDESIAQILSYMGALSEIQKRPVRGILVAGDFHDRVVFAARTVPNLQLKKYSVTFSFEEIK